MAYVVPFREQCRVAKYTLVVFFQVLWQKF
nr:MAG TPA: hypothetical protein [Caudoviricetes sp.]